MTKRIRPFRSLRVALLAALGLAVLGLPVLALLVRVPWSGFGDLLVSQSARQALWVSLACSLIAALLAVLLGVPLAWWLVHLPSRIGRVVRAIALTPLVLPPSVAGVALLALLGRNGLLGHWLYANTGWSMPFTSTAVVLAGLFVGLPFTVLVVEAAFAAVPKQTLQAAQADGAPGWQLFRSVAVPQALHSIWAGAVLSWARAFGEFGATLMFAGSLPGVTRTIPMQVYLDMESNRPAAYALSALMVVVAVAVTFVLRGPLSRALR